MASEVKFLVQGDFQEASSWGPDKQTAKRWDAPTDGYDGRGGGLRTDKTSEDSMVS